MVSLCKLRLSGSFRHLQADSRGLRGPCLSGYAKRLDPGPSIGSWVKWPLIRVSQSSTLLFEMCGLPITINNLYIWGPKQRNYKHHNTPLRFPPIAFHMPSPLISMVCYNQQNQQMNVTWITCQRASSKPFDIDNGNQWISWYGSVQTRAMPSCASQHLRCPESGTTSAKHPVANMASTCQISPWSN